MSEALASLRAALDDLGDLRLTTATEGEVVELVDALTEAQSRLTSSLGRVQAFTKHVGTRRASVVRAARKCDGEQPTMSANVRLNVPRLAKPTARQMSVTGVSVARNRYIARSMRRRWR